jgi:hypothetical protein
MIGLLLVVALIAVATMISNSTYFAGQQEMFCKLSGGVRYDSSNLPDSQPRGDFYCMIGNKLVTYDNELLN